MMRMGRMGNASIVICLLLFNPSGHVQASRQPTGKIEVQKQLDTPAPSVEHPINVTVNVPAPDPQIALIEAEDRKANLEIQWWIASATIALAVFTVLQLVFGYLGFKTSARAADAARSAANTAEAALRSTERAYIAHTKFLVQPWLDETDTPIGWALQSGVMNTGRTPGNRVGLSFMHFVGDGNNAPVVNIPSIPEAAMGALPPIAEGHSEFVFLPYEDCDRLAAGSITIWLVGKIEYRDVFDTAHTSVATYGLKVVRNIRTTTPGHDPFSYIQVGGSQLNYLT